MKKLFKLMMAVVLAATPILPVSAEKHYTVTVDLGEGIFWKDGSHKKTVYVKEGERLIDRLDNTGVVHEGSERDPNKPITQDGGPCYQSPEGYGLVGFSLSGETEITLTESEFYQLRPNRDMELNARYGKIITIHFDFNGGSSSGKSTYSTTSIEGKNIYGFGVTQSPNENEVFAGWSTSKNGEPEYTNDDLSRMKAACEMTFYAIYRLAVTITLDGNGGKDYYGDTRTYKAPKGYPFEEYVGPFNPPSSDKEFIGWSKTKNGNVDYETLDNAVFNEDTTLYAVYRDMISLISCDIPEEITMNVGDEIVFPFTVSPENANYSLSLSSYDASVASSFYPSNRILAHREGVTEIEYNINGKKSVGTNESKHFSGTIKVTVKMPYIDRAFLGIGDKQYWYENSVRQGMLNDAKNIIGDGTPRGREIYDPASDGWYWLDAIYDGAKAEGKEVWVPYVYQDESKWGDAEIRMNADHADEGMKEYTYQCMKNKTGKWVRYDENGKMLKGWVKIENELARIYPEQAGNTYYYDHYTGLMAKGRLRIGGVDHYFDEITGVMVY